MHNKSVKLRRARCTWSIILVKVLNQRVVFTERRVESLVVCKSLIDKQYSIFYTNAFGVHGFYGLPASPSSFHDNQHRHTHSPRTYARRP